MRLPRCSSTRALAGSVFGAALAATLAGCGGSLDGRDYDLTAQTPSSLSGTVALGAPMLDATVSVQDANGIVVSVPVERDGSYGGLSLVGLAAPLSLQACGRIEGNTAATTASSTPDGTGNVRPLALDALSRSLQGRPPIAGRLARRRSPASRAARSALSAFSAVR